MLKLLKSLVHHPIPASMLGITLMLGASSVSAQGRALEELRSRVRPGPQQLVVVANNCQAYSAVPNESGGYVTLWEGPCVEGYAHGDGIRRFFAAGELLAISRGRHDKGRWTRVDESYSLTLGRIVTRLIDPKSGLSYEKAIDPSKVPAWARELVAALPNAQKAWAEEVVRRQAEARRISGRLQEEGDEEDTREMLFGPIEGEANAES